MKLQILAAAFLAAASFAHAQVPGLINYQGRLPTPSGAPATGTRNFSLSIFDAETGGTLLYTEAVGPVTLDATGVYSFQFGSAGTSNTQVMETLATTDGTASSFQKVLANTGIVAGSLSVTDGTYTWSQSAGSSNEDDFGVAYSSSLRRVTVSYFSAPPAAGKPITATYRYATSGIAGAISAGSQHWMALSIDGVVQAGRQRVLAVPFAMQAGFAARAGELVEKERVWRPQALYSIAWSNQVVVTTYPLMYGISAPSVGGRAGEFVIDSSCKRISGITIKGWMRSPSADSKSRISIMIRNATTGAILFEKQIFGKTGNDEDDYSFSLKEKLGIQVNPSEMYIATVDLNAGLSNNGKTFASVSDVVLLLSE